MGHDHGAGSGTPVPNAIFHANFTQINKRGGRSGPLNPDVWFVTRVNTDANPGQGRFNEHFSAVGNKCGTRTYVRPPFDYMICSGANPDNAHVMEVFDDQAQGYHYNSAMIRQPFDFAARTGKFRMEVDLKAWPHGHWCELWFVQDPIPAPHARFGGALPKNAIAVEFWFNTNTLVGMVGNIYKFDNHVLRTYGLDSLGGEPGTATFGPGFTFKDNVRNIVEVDMSTAQIKVSVSNHDSATLVQQALLTGDTIGFDRCYAAFQHSAYRGREFGDLQTHTFHWGGISFDGPHVDPMHGHEIPDAMGGPSNAKPQDATNLGYLLVGSTGKTFRQRNNAREEITAPFPVMGLVRKTDLVQARLAVNIWNMFANADELYYTLNGGTERTITNEDGYNPEYTVAGYSAVVNPADLVEGVNTITFRAQSDREYVMANAEIQVVHSHVDVVPDPEGDAPMFFTAKGVHVTHYVGHAMFPMTASGVATGESPNVGDAPMNITAYGEGSGPGGGGVGTPVVIGTSSSDSATRSGSTTGRMLHIAPSDARAIEFYHNGTDHVFRTAPSPYSTWSAETSILATNFSGMAAHMNSDDSINLVYKDNLIEVAHRKLTRSGATWTVGSSATIATTHGGGNNVLTALIKDTAGTLWSATKDAESTGDVNVHYSINDGAAWFLAENFAVATNPNFSIAQVGSYIVFQAISDYSRHLISGTYTDWSALTANSIPTGALDYPSFMADGLGLGVHLLGHGEGGGAFAIRVSTYNATTDTWTDLGDIGTNALDTDPVLVRVGNDLYGVWSEYAAANSYAIVTRKWTAATQTWGTKETLAVSGTNQRWPVAGADSNYLLACWTKGTADPYDVVVGSLGFGGGGGSPSGIPVFMQHYREQGL